MGKNFLLWSLSNKAAIEMYPRKAAFSARIAAVAPTTAAEVTSSPGVVSPIDRIGPQNHGRTIEFKPHE